MSLTIFVRVKKGRLGDDKRDRGRRDAVDDGANGSSVSSSNLSMLVTMRKGNHPGEA